MANSSPGSYHLFRLFGISVFIHWSWFVVALLFLMTDRFSPSPAWGALTYVSLFVIVLMHEFGHALACRSVGGRADNIVLWPLGGIAFVQPPQRPWPVLWSIAAGPLVNVVLVPVTVGLYIYFTGGFEIAAPRTEFHEYLFLLTFINLGLLIFNMLPIYPLDGGQILQAILWFFMGRAKSLTITASIGIIAAIAGGVWALSRGDTWLVLIAAFVGWQAWNGLRYARALAQSDNWRM